MGMRMTIGGKSCDGTSTSSMCIYRWGKVTGQTTRCRWVVGNLQTGVVGLITVMSLDENLIKELMFNPSFTLGQ